MNTHQQIAEAPTKRGGPDLIVIFNHYHVEWHGLICYLK